MHRRTRRLILSTASLLLATSGSMAQSTITSLGSGTPQGISNNTAGAYYVGGTGSGTSGAQGRRWALSGSTLGFANLGGASGSYISSDGAYLTGTYPNNTPRIFGNTATAVSPVFSTTPTLIASATQPAATELAGRRWNSSTSTWESLGGLPINTELAINSATVTMMTFGSGSSGGSTGSFLSPNAMSRNGQFIVGQGYISSYSSAAGTTVSDNTFRWVPWIWNASTGTMKVLRTPVRTSSNTWRPRTGAAYAVSNDGLVVAGYQEHNSSVLPAADPDGARPVVWRWNAGTSTFDMTYLPNGVDGSGFPYTISATAGSMHMNAAGTIIVGMAATNNTGSGYLAKWVWNSGTSTWDAPINLGSNLSTPASWLPVAVTSCSIPPTLSPTGMSDDGNTVVGFVTYSTCSSFMRGGFIWHAADGLIQDWYDYQITQGTPGIAENYGPIGDNSDMTKGLPKLGNPSGIAPDGSAFVGFQGGAQIIADAVPWILQNTGGPACVPPTITSNPAATVTISQCSFGGTTTNNIILSAGAGGTLPITYQWYKDASPLSNGTSVGGGAITGATSFQLRIAAPGPADAGSYYCIATGCSGNTATTTSTTVTWDGAVVAPSNDTCGTATAVGEGTFNFNPCGATVDDGASSCLNLGQAEIADVWYAYTPTFTGAARFQTCASTFDTTIQLYDACNGAILSCNNDVGARGVAGLGSACGSTRAVISSYNVTAGVPVWVRIGCISMPTSNSATSGALTISQAPAAPANDLCANATVVDVGTHSFNLSEATDDFTFGTDSCSTPVDSQTASNRDVWFRFTSPCGGVYSFTTCGLASPNITNPMLHIMAPDCQGTVFTCDDNTSGCTVGGTQQAQVTGYAMAAGETVLVRVSQSGTGSPGTNALSGTGQLNITGTSNCGACCNSTACTTTTSAGCTGSFQGAGTACGPVGNPTTCCPANYNGVGGVTVQDIFDFLAGYFSNNIAADFNHSGAVSVQDIFDFLAAYFTGCV
jgi:hypothetical protein